MDSHQMAAKGLRGINILFILSIKILFFLVLAMATGSSLDDLVYVGMVGIIDPERPQVEQAVSQLKAGGVMVKMITGDAEKTAKAIASRLKIYNGTDLTISGEDLDHMNAAELDNAISKATIFYRVSPKHKLTIVKVNFNKQKISFLKNYFLQDFTSTRTYCRYDR
jgi:magnesium-transporting ATPase (P-type)